MYIRQRGNSRAIELNRESTATMANQVDQPRRNARPDRVIGCTGRFFFFFFHIIRMRQTEDDDHRLPRLARMLVRNN